MLPRVQPYHYGIGGNTTLGYFEDINTRTLESVTVGQGAGKINYGAGNAFVGYNAGHQNNEGGYNTFLGYQSGYNNTSGSLCTMIGAYSGRQNQGDEVVFVGYRAGELNTFGEQVVAVGSYAMRENVSGTGSVAIGYRACERNQDGDFNTIIGAECGQDNRSGNMNTMCGFRAGRANFVGSENTYFGAFSGYSNSYGSGNSFIGYKSGENIAFGNLNVAIGAYSLQNAASAECNVVIGPYASRDAVNGTNCVVIGKGACTYGDGNANVYLGSDAGQCNVKDNNVMIGFAAGATANAQNTVIIGAESGKRMEANHSVIIGANTGNRLIDGSSNVIIGAGADTYSSTVMNGICIGSENSFTNSYDVTIGHNIFNRRSFSTLVGNDLECDADNSVVVGNNINIQSSVYFKDPLNFTIKDVVLSDAIAKLGIDNITYGENDDLILDLLDPSLPYPFAKAGYYTSNEYSSATNSVVRDYIPVTMKTLEINPDNYPTIFTHGIVIPIRTQQDIADISSITKTTVICSDIQNVITETTHYINPEAYVLRHNSNIIYEYTRNNVITNIYNFNTSNVEIPIVVPKLVQSPEAASSNVSINLTGAWYDSVNVVLPGVQMQGDGIDISNDSNVYYVVTKAPLYGRLSSNVFQVGNAIEYIPHIEHAYTTTNDEFQLIPTIQIKDENGECYGRSGSPVKVDCTRSNVATQYMAKQIIMNPQNYPFTKTDLVAVPHLDPNALLRFDVISPHITINTSTGSYSNTSLEPLFVSYSDLDTNNVLITNNETHDIQGAFNCTVNGISFAYSTIYPSNYELSPFFPGNLTSVISQFSTTRSTTYTANDMDSVFITKYPSSGTVTVESSNITYTVYNPYSQSDTIRFLLSSNVARDEIVWNLNFAPSLKYTNMFYGYLSKFGNEDTVSSYIHINVSSNEIPLHDTTINIVNGIQTSVSRIPIQYDPVIGYRVTASNLETYSTMNIVPDDLNNIGSNTFFNTYAVSMIYVDIFGTSNIYPYTVIESSNVINYQANFTGINSNVYLYSNLHIYDTINQSFDKITNIYGHSNKTNNYYNALTPSQLLYSSSSYISEPASSNISYVPTTTTSAYEYTYIDVVVENRDIYESYIQLNSNLLYYPNESYFNNQECVVVSNIGVVNTFTQNQINNRNVYIRNTVGDTFVVFLASFQQNLVIPVSLFDAQRTINITNSYVQPIDVTLPSLTINNALNPVTKNIPFAPTSVHIIDVNGGYVWTNNFTLPLPITQNIEMSVYGHHDSSSIQFIYSSNNFQYVTTPITYTFNLARAPFALQQRFNVGISLDKNTLSPYVFHWNSSTTLSVVDKSPNVTLSMDTFTINDVLENRIVATFDTDNLTNGYVRFQDNTKIDLIPYFFNHYLHPNKTGVNTLRIQDIALEGHKNQGTGELCDFLQALYLEGVPYSSSKIQLFVATKLNDGYIWNRSQPYKIAHSFTLGDIENDNIYFIPFDATNMQNQVIQVIVKYDNDLRYSYSYNFIVKNYVSRFDNVALCSTYKQQSPINTTLIFRSQGLIQDGIVWTPSIFTPPVLTSNIATYTRDLTLGDRLYNWTFDLYADSTAIRTNSIPDITYNIGRTEAVSLNTLISPILNLLSFNDSKSQDLLFYVTTSPRAGLIQNMQTQSFSMVEFTIDDVTSGNIVYQHYGTTITQDGFTLTLATTPYDISNTTINVRIQIREPPTITSYNTIHVYASNMALATSQLNNVYPNVNISSQGGYISFFRGPGINLVNVDTLDVVNSMDVVTISIADYAANKVKFRLEDPYADKTMYAITTLTNDAKNFNIIQHPFYENYLKTSIPINFNKYTSVNTLFPGKSDVQIISYTINPFLEGFANFVDKSFSAVMQVNPYQDLLNSTVSDPSLLISEKQIPKKFSFTVSFVTAYGSIDTTITESRVDCVLFGQNSNIIIKPDGDVLKFNEWNNLLFNSQDTDYPVFMDDGSFAGYEASFYFGYDPSLSKLQNRSKNLLAGEKVVLPFFDILRKIEVSIDNTYENNILFTSNVSFQTNDVSVAYDLQNYGTQLQFKNIELYTTTISPVSLNDISKNVVDHNIVLGKSILVRGVNNICIGNNFNTSGQNSIILGNTIGAGITKDGFINDVYESIIIGNNSFQNSLVNNVISIGNNNLNELNFLERSRVTGFLATKPVLIGNDIQSIEFNINVGNTFLKSTNAGNKIFLGFASEPVCIGCTTLTNDTSMNGSMLDVNGGVTCSHISTSDILITTFNTPNLLDLLHKIVSVNPNSTNDAFVYDGLMTSNILGVCTGNNSIQYQGFADILSLDINIGIGDLVTSSNGYAMRQPDDIVRSYTVGRAISVITNNKVRCRLL